MPPPELCQSPHCSRFVPRIPARTAENRPFAAESRGGGSRQTPNSSETRKSVGSTGGGIAPRRLPFPHAPRANTLFSVPLVVQQGNQNQSRRGPRGKRRIPLCENPIGPRQEFRPGRLASDPVLALRMSDAVVDLVFRASARAGRQPGAGEMIRYSCDLCKRKLDPKNNCTTS